jgi:hypothetical protein
MQGYVIEKRWNRDAVPLGVCQSNIEDMLFRLDVREEDELGWYSSNHIIPRRFCFPQCLAVTGKVFDARDMLKRNWELAQDHLKQTFLMDGKHGSENAVLCHHSCSRGLEPLLVHISRQLEGIVM